MNRETIRDYGYVIELSYPPASYTAQHMRDLINDIRRIIDNVRVTRQFIETEITNFLEQFNQGPNRRSIICLYSQIRSKLSLL